MIPTEEPQPRKFASTVPTQDISIFGEVALPTPAFPLGESTFASVFANRHSTRVGRPLNLQKLSNLLWLANRGPSPDQSKANHNHRVSPSAGGIHPIEIVVTNIEEISDSIFWYQHRAHNLGAIGNSTTARTLNHQAQDCVGALGTIVWLAGSVQRVGAKYEGPLNLLLRDAGALLATISLAATACNIGSTFIGATGSNVISSLPWKCSCVGLGGIALFSDANHKED